MPKKTHALEQEFFKPFHAKDPRLKTHIHIVRSKTFKVIKVYQLIPKYKFCHDLFQDTFFCITQKMII